jgi:two-component system chemotaxis response regulator CheB
MAIEPRDIIVIGASAGGVTALKDLVKGLPADFGGSVFIVLHIPPYSESRLPWILSNAGLLDAIHPQDGDMIEPGKIYVATNDHHLLVEEGKVRVRRGPKENKFRPSIDALFRSAAYVYRERVIGIILSGMLDDGVSGLWTIKQLGGLAIIQSPEDAEQSQLPDNVRQHVDVDYTLPAAEMGPLLSGLVKQAAPERNKFTLDELKQLEKEVIIATKDNALELGVFDMGELTPFTCPQCHGALVRLVEGNLMRFRCHTGHAYTASSLLAEVSETVEEELWQSMRGLEEMTMLMNNISDKFAAMGDVAAADLFRAKAEESGHRARLIHHAVYQQNQYSEDLRLNREK